MASNHPPGPAGNGCSPSARLPVSDGLLPAHLSCTASLPGEDRQQGRLVPPEGGMATLKPGLHRVASKKSGRGPESHTATFTAFTADSVSFCFPLSFHLEVNGCLLIPSLFPVLKRPPHFWGDTRVFPTVFIPLSPKTNPLKPEGGMENDPPQGGILARPQTT